MKKEFILYKVGYGFYRDPEIKAELFLGIDFFFDNKIKVTVEDIE